MVRQKLKFLACSRMKEDQGVDKVVAKSILGKAITDAIIALASTITMESIAPQLTQAWGNRAQMEHMKTCISEGVTIRIWIDSTSTNICSTNLISNRYLGSPSAPLSRLNSNKHYLHSSKCRTRLRKIQVYSHHLTLLKTRTREATSDWYKKGEKIENLSSQSSSKQLTDQWFQHSYLRQLYSSSKV